MRPDWDEKVKQAQHHTGYVIGGKEYSRIKWGSELHWASEEEETCHDCGVKKGQFHVSGCDVEECPACEGQAISCECNYEYDVIERQGLK